MMGSPKGEPGRDSNETQHEVTLTQGYWLGKYEVTQEQYETIMGTNPSDVKEDVLPVDSVSWNEAMEFCAKLNAQEKAAGRLPEGYEYSLPTESQWDSKLLSVSVNFGLIMLQIIEAAYFTWIVGGALRGTPRWKG